MVFCNYYFGWVAGGEFKVFDKTVIYTYTEVVDLLGHNKFKYTINGVSSIKLKGKNLIVKGDIVYKRPLGKASVCEKCIVYDIDDKAQKYLKIELLNFHYFKILKSAYKNTKAKSIGCAFTTEETTDSSRCTLF